MSPRLSKVEIRPSKSNVPGNSIVKDMHHESIGQRKVMKYLKEN